MNEVFATVLNTAVRQYRVLTTNYWSPIGSLGVLVNQISI